MSKPVTYMEGGRWLDGPKFTEWFEPFTRSRADTCPRHLRESLVRGFRNWSQGGAVSLRQADYYLTQFDLHPSLVPDDIWLPYEDWPEGGPPQPRRKEPKTHCIHGHPFSPENTTIIRNKRVCLTCRRQRDALRRPPQNRRWPVEPLAEWITQLHDELGTWRAVGERVGLSTSTVYSFATKRAPRVNQSTLERLMGDEWRRVYGKEAA